MKIIIKITVTLLLVFTSSAYAAKWEVKGCEKDEITDDITWGGVQIYLPLDGKYIILDYDLYGLYSEYIINIFTADIFFDADPDTDEYGTSWRFNTDIRFEPSGESVNLAWVSSSGYDSIYSPLPKAGTYGSEVNPDWVSKRLFAQKELKIRIPFFKSGTTIFNIPLDGFEEEVIKLIEKCKGKREPVPSAESHLPERLHKLLK